MYSMPLCNWIYDHLIFKCTFAIYMWNHFEQVFILHDIPDFFDTLWDSWRNNLRCLQIETWDFISRALIWGIWLQWNNWMFNHFSFSHASILTKIIYTFLLWWRPQIDVIFTNDVLIFFFLLRKVDKPLIYWTLKPVQTRNQSKT